MTWLLVTIRPDGIDDDAGAERALNLVARNIEEAPHHRIVKERITRLSDPLGGIDIDHRGGGTLDDRRIGQANVGGGIRNAPGLGRLGGRDRWQR